jgi:GT2 family glycosyltransferase
MTARLSIIIVNYRSMPLLLDCLETIYRETSMPLELIVVDNDSNDNGESILRERFPEVQWVQMGYNSGFARANNEGIRRSTGEAVLLLNPDILIEERSIEKSFERMMASEHIACGIQLLNRDRTPQISGNYFIRGGINNLLPLPFLGKIIKRLGNFLKIKKTNIPEATSEVQVDWINGAFLMVKKTAIQKTGLLDEDFFLYAEEIEWCARLHKAGTLCIYGDLHIIHLQGETANEAFASAGQGYHNLFDRKGRQILVSNFLRIRKQFGTGWFLLHLFFYLAEIPFFLFLTISPRYTFRQWKGFCSNLLYLLRLTPSIISGRRRFYKVL